MSRRKRNNVTRAEIEVEAEDAASAAEQTAPPEVRASEPEAPSADDEIERLRREAGEMRDLAQRKQAEFENYRKRMERERLDLTRYAGADVVKEILPVLDNLERALRASRDSPEEQLREGVAIIHRQLQEILSRLGLSEVESQGKPFDPHVHEAVTQTETKEHPEGTVLDVLQKGYLFHDRLLRPAMVNVARAASGGGDEDQAPAEESEGVPGSD